MRVPEAAEEKRVQVDSGFVAWNVRSGGLVGADFAAAMKERLRSMKFGLTYGRGSTKKEAVRSREERMESLGDPKAPRMGGLAPKTVDLPEVDGLLEEMERSARKRRFPRILW